jgi:hypothetical protein
MKQQQGSSGKMMSRRSRPNCKPYQLAETSNNRLLNSDFAEAFQNRSSVLLSGLGQMAPSTIDARMMLKICEEQMKVLLQEFGKRAKGHRIRWDRMKEAFLAKRLGNRLRTSIAGVKV